MYSDFQLTSLINIKLWESIQDTAVPCLYPTKLSQSRTRQCRVPTPHSGKSRISHLSTLISCRSSRSNHHPINNCRDTGLPCPFCRVRARSLQLQNSRHSSHQQALKQFHPISFSQHRIGRPFRMRHHS